MKPLKWLLKCELSVGVRIAGLHGGSSMFVMTSSPVEELKTKL